ncbi:site-specific DNA-methyltransferase [Clostridium sp. DMHC 10]|uniref:site-specific DNA-methyltransferase n=1 Tax=Clostridium sp. DMHC 10 TaxID=747377 RepID=UPI000AC7A873
MDKMNGYSLDIVKENLERLREIFPEVFCEDKIDFERLQEALGEYIEDKDERYRFEWHGKSQAVRMAQTPSRGTLRPCKEESKNWDITENLYIEGDNLEVLKLLQKSYQGKVKMIYIDPPYNTGNDFVYKDDYKDNLSNYLAVTGQIDEEGNKTTTNSETGGRFHTNWLNMMYPRLRLARNLLKEDGVICISIDENEHDNLKFICNEILMNLILQVKLFGKIVVKMIKIIFQCNMNILCFMCITRTLIKVSGKKKKRD